MGSFARQKHDVAFDRLEESRAYVSALENSRRLALYDVCMAVWMYVLYTV